MSDLTPPPAFPGSVSSVPASAPPAPAAPAPAAPTSVAPASAASSTQLMDLSHVDYTALTRTVAPAEIRAFRAQVRSEQRANPGISTGLSTATGILGILFFIVFIGIFGAIFIGVLYSASSDGSNPTAGGIVPILFMVAFIALTVLILVRHFGSAGPWAKYLRLTRFAAANGLEYRTRSNNPSYTGMIFAIGDTRFAYDHLNSTTGRFFDLGSYEYSTGSGKNRSTSHWGFLALKLDRKLPNMVLDSKENNSLFGSDLPEHFRRDQILSLEGDFDQHFTLYCPEEYETDALYVFTPDLMALLIDDAGSFDVEIVDDWMFVYAPHGLAPLSPTVYQRLFTIIEAVGNKTISQTANYHDDRVAQAGADIVAPQGQRLRHGTSVIGIVIMAGFAAFWLFSFFHGN